MIAFLKCCIQFHGKADSHFRKKNPRPWVNCINRANILYYRLELNYKLLLKSISFNWAMVINFPMDICSLAVATLFYFYLCPPLPKWGRGGGHIVFRTDPVGVGVAVGVSVGVKLLVRSVT